MTTPDQPSRRDLANAIRFLAIDAVQAANSGHPGMPMGMADIAEVLWNDFLHFNPANPKWPNRDRFVLSNGHGSMLQYALLHLAGFDLPIDELKRFRQLGSRTPGHPENHVTPGIPRSAARPASRRPPGRSGRALPTPSAWRSPRSCSRRISTSRVSTSSTITPTSSWATAA